MAEVETQVLSRLLKMLERNVRAGEDVDPFWHPTPTYVAPGASPSKKSPKKPTKTKKAERRSKSKTPGEDEEDGAAERSGGSAVVELTESDFDKLLRSLEIARDSVIAADCCIALLGSDRLTKQV